MHDWFLVGKTEGQRPQGRPSYIREGDINMVIKEIE
jgi:hypothetical protein